MISIREERSGDYAAVRVVNELAFGQPVEATLVDALRENCREVLSLVAVEADKVVGHILFSPVQIDTPSGPLEGMGLAPMAVLPEYQRKKVGSAMVRQGLAILRQRGCPYAIVLGHPKYYPRFGFAPAAKFGLRCQWDGMPEEAFMALSLQQDSLKGANGIARYRPEFDAVV